MRWVRATSAALAARALSVALLVALLVSGCAGGDDAPTASVDPELERLVIEAATTSWRLLDSARLDPDDQARTEAAIAAYFGPAREQVTEVLTGYRLNEQRSVTDEVVPATVVPYPGTVVVDGNEATVEYCQVDTNLLVRDGTREVLDDEPDSHRMRVRMVLVDDRWLEAGGELLETFDGATTCPDLP